MAKQRPVLDEETLRETRDDLLTRVTDQQRKFGMLPDVRAAEQFVDPILRKTEVVHNEAREKDVLRSEPPRRNPAPDDMRFSRRGEKLADGSRRFEEPIGTFLMGKPGAGLKPLGPVRDPFGRKRVSPEIALDFECLRRARVSLDEKWKAEVYRILTVPMTGPARERALRKLARRWRKENGDPRKPHESKIYVSR